jgi:putative ABC transport system permease protein
MLPSWQLARNTLAGKPGRTALMTGAVALAASLVVAVSCGIGSVQASLEHGIVKLLGRADARIVHQGNGRFDEKWLDQVRSWPEVQHATGRLLAAVTLVHADGRRDPQTNELLRATPSAIGVDFSLEPLFRQTTLIAGSLPKSNQQILIDPLTAEQLQAQVGDKLQVQRFGEPIDLQVAGIYERPRLGAVQRPQIEMDIRQLAEAADRQGQLTNIMIILKRGMEKEPFCARHAGDIPQILSLEPAEMVRSGFDRQVQASRFGFTIASILTFMSASFIIVTALTTSVTERQREMAVTRCIGASRPQLFVSQLMAGSMLAGWGAAIGIPLGIALAGLLVWHFRELLPAGLYIHPLGIELALIGAAASGVLGALYPAWMASHVSPLQAMTYRGRPPRASSIFLSLAIALLFILIQLALFTLPDPSTRFKFYAYLGLPSVLLGYFILAAPLLFDATLGLCVMLARMLHLPADMLRRSVLGSPFRHGFTAGAMMVGIAILVSTWASMTSIMQDWIGKIRFADGFAFRTTGISPREQAAIANLPFVKSVCLISYLPLRVYGRQIFGVRGFAPPNVTCMGFDPDEFFAMNAVEWVAGDPATAIEKLKDGSGLIVADRFLTTQKVNVGDHLTLGVGRVRKDFEIVGAVNSAGLDIATQTFGIRSQYMEYSISCVFMDWDTVNKTFDNRDAHMIQMNLADDVSDKRAIEEVARVAPGVQFYSGRFIRTMVNDVAATLLAVQSTIAFTALLLACLGVGNVILANIHGRKYEYGVLRAVGGHKSLLAKLIFAEAAILAITGALTGTLLGTHLAWIAARNYRDLAGLPVRLTLPALPILAGWIVLVLMTLLAALPGVLSVVRRQPSALLAAGRHG